MAVVSELAGLDPDLDGVRELARDANVVPVRMRLVDDCETPVSAFLKLRGDGPCFLLESAEQGQVGRWSFLGFRPRSVLRWAEGTLSEWLGEQALVGGEPTRTSAEADPYAAVAEYLERYRLAPVEDLPPFPGGAVGYFGYDLVRTVEPLAEPNPDTLGLPDMALMLSDVLVVFDHLRHTITILVNVYASEPDDVEAAYAGALATIAKARDLLAGPVPRSAPQPDRPVPAFESNMSRADFEATVARIIAYVHAGDAFQVVPSQRWSGAVELDPFSVYRG